MPPKHDSTRVTVSNGITFNEALCIGCNQCVTACDEQAINVFQKSSEKFHPPTFKKTNFEDSNCIQCGMCVLACPVNSMQITKAKIEDDSIFLVAPSSRVVFAEKFEQQNEKLIIEALNQLKSKKVYDVNFGADLTTIVDCKEYLHLKEKNMLPLYSSCCPGWVNYCEKFYPELLPQVSTAKSCVEMLSTLVNEENMIQVMPCTAKKDEIKRAVLNSKCKSVITVRELFDEINSRGIKIDLNSEAKYDTPYHKSSGGAVNFGKSGGVATTVINQLAKWQSKEPVLVKSETIFTLKKQTLIRDEYTLGEDKVVFLVASGGTAMQKAIEIVKSGEKIDFVEMMACPGGCIGGGGTFKAPKLAKRIEMLQQISEKQDVQIADENDTIHVTEEEYNTKLIIHSDVE